MTRKDNKLMKQFFVNYNGEEINIEPHITFYKINKVYTLYILRIIRNLS